MTRHFRDKVVPGLSFPAANAVKILLSAPSRAGNAPHSHFFGNALTGEDINVRCDADRTNR